MQILEKEKHKTYVGKTKTFFFRRLFWHVYILPTLTVKINYRIGKKKDRGCRLPSVKLPHNTKSIPKEEEEEKISNYILSSFFSLYLHNATVNR
jgi:hypothetical protein